MSDKRGGNRPGQSGGAGPGDLRNYEFSFNFSLPSGEIEPDVCFFLGRLYGEKDQLY